ncbi:hypothetical protein EPUS_05877 [Endocarpon pusillum Z07020]|uniref:Effector 5 n=1 Tax=Endocarpon pusillum (strain Z07020 / HMAS-L-300199) TaxID=1263415 RepID=U1HTF4_ENDPU|nr:uncharacterized protein EPUS_05877 [Endocarpon pusillum Z07020]ERF73865.1 hypothetical protein EPUS_05877 [Endocarpon pusillum Z07020]
MAIGQAVAGPFKHSHFHAKKEADPLNLESTVVKRSGALTEGHSVKLLSEMAFSALGKNSELPADGVWLGDNGPYTNEFWNESGEDLILVIWGPEASWVNVKQPLITASIANGSSTTVSFASGQSGAWSAIYDDTAMLNGQISNTWGEYTFSPSGVVDVSRLPNMKGNAMTIVGPTCVSDMTRCVFECPEGEDICMYNYKLVNCAPESQVGAQFGYDYGAASGGCGNLGDSAQLSTYLS